MNLIELPIDTITPSPRNIRTELGDLTELADSIRSIGILQPLVVTPKGEPGTGFILVAGHRRLAAAKEAGLTSVPAVVNHDLVGDTDVAIAMLIENTMRRDLNPIEEAVAYEQLGLFGLSAGDIAKRTGRSKHLVESRTRLMALSEGTRDKVAAHQITLGQAETLLDLADEFSADELTALEATLLEYGESQFRWKVENIRRGHEHEARKAAAAAEKAASRAEDEPADEQHSCRGCWKNKVADVDGRCDECTARDAATQAAILRTETAHAVRRAWLREQYATRDHDELLQDLARVVIARLFDNEREDLTAELDFLGIGYDADSYPDVKDITGTQAALVLALFYGDLLTDSRWTNPGVLLGPLAEFAGYEMSDEERAMFDEWDAKR